MTATEHNGSSGDGRRVLCGSYVHGGVEHILLAMREDDARWRLLDVDRDTTTVIESFYPDEELDAVRGVAKLYLADQHIEGTAAR